MADDKPPQREEEEEPGHTKGHRDHFPWEEEVVVVLHMEDGDIETGKKSMDDTTVEGSTVPNVENTASDTAEEEEALLLMLR